MTKQKKFKPFSAIISVSILTICLVSVQAIASDPPSGNADASACSSLLLDRQVVQGTKEFKPEDLSIYNSDVKPILELADQLPDFGDALKKALKKKWRFAYDDFKKCPTEYSMYTSTTVKVACQTPDEVIVNPDWYSQLDGRSCRGMTNAHAIQALKQKQRDFFVHEMLLGITLGTPISTDASSIIFNDLTLQPRPSAEKLQRDLESSHFGIYRLGARSPVAQKIPAQKPAISHVSLDDLLKSETVEISTLVNGHYISGGTTGSNGDVSKSVAAQICKQAGYSDVVSVDAEKVEFPKDAISHPTLGYSYAKVSLVEVSPNGSEPMHLENYDMTMYCKWGDCEVDFVRPIAIKSVRCKKNATAGDVLAVNDQMSSHSDADRRLAGSEEKPSRSFYGSSGSENKSQNGAAN